MKRPISPLRTMMPTARQKANNERPVTPEDSLRPGLVTFTGQEPYKIYLDQDVGRTWNGRLGLTAHFSMIVKVAGLWYEIWCPYCGVNATKYKVHFLRGASGLTRHMRAKHLSNMPEKAQYAKDWTNDDTLKICGKELMHVEELEELCEGIKIPKLVHISKGKRVKGLDNGVEEEELSDREIARRSYHPRDTDPDR